MNLYEHQRKIVEADPERAGLFLGTGTGKTRTALMLARGSTLVIAPKTQVQDRNWEREFEKLGRETIIDDLKVISKETFRRDHSSLPVFDTVIVDEAHTCLGITPNTRWRNKQQVPHTSQLFDALHTYLERTQPKRLYLCSATIVKSPFTVFAAAVLLKKTLYDMQGFFQFRHTYYTKLPMPGREVWVPKKDSATKNKLAYYVRSIGFVGRLADYFDVPEQSFKNHDIPLTTAQKERLKELPREFPEPIVRLGKRHQVENGIENGDEFTESREYPSGKIDAILEYAEEFPQMIVFARYTAQIRAIEEALKKEFPDRPVFKLTGETKDRGMMLATVNKTPEYTLIAQAQVSAGWEVPECPVMIFASRTYSFVDYDQALGRIHRANHIKPNLYINLVVRGGIDEAVHDALENKQDFNERIYVEHEDD